MRQSVAVSCHSPSLTLSIDQNFGAIAIRPQQDCLFIYLLLSVVGSSLDRFKQLMHHDQ